MFVNPHRIRVTRSEQALVFAVLAIALAAPSQARAELLVRQTFRGVVPVAGLDGVRGAMDAQMLLVRSWRPFIRDDSAGTLRARSVIGSCRQDIRFTLRLVVSAAPTTAEHLSLRLPNRPGVPLIDKGQRDDGAWRVVRGTRGQTSALYAAPSAHRRWTGLKAGERVFREVHVATTPTGSCTGLRTRKIARSVGDALATTATRAGNASPP
jgi:hypothetical protein